MKIVENLHMIIGTALLIFFAYYYYTGSVKKNELLIDSFEGKINSETVDFGSSSNSSISVSSSSKVSKCGTRSLQMNYNLNPSGYVYSAKGYGLYHRKDSSSWTKGRAGWDIHPDEIQWDQYDAFSFYLRGSDNGHVAFDIKDARGELWRRDVYVDLKGWQKFTIPFASFSARIDWQPATATRNHLLDFPIKSFQFEPKKPGQRTLYVDCVKLEEI